MMIGLLFATVLQADPLIGRVSVNATKTPEHAVWAQSAERLANEWYPRIGNLLSSSIEVTLPEVQVEISPDYDGVAAASGSHIRLSAKWVKDHPDDARGVIVHELVHVVQAYPNNREGWITEGIADYIRNGIYESWPLAKFPRPTQDRAYQQGYRVAGGFLLWLESGPSPGIVRRLNATLRNDTYRPTTFQEFTGKSAEELWVTYGAEMSPPRHLPSAPRKLVYGGDPGGAFERRDDGSWVELQDGKLLWKFRETGRTTHHIELLDEGRNLRLRLTLDQVLLGRGDSWSPLYTGTWSP